MAASDKRIHDSASGTEPVPHMRHKQSEAKTNSAGSAQVPSVAFDSSDVPEVGSMVIL
ncbi:hypothetical protein GCM10023324_38130 [Streptomyces youssoufiensis]